jgi:purine-binding chemotaxis protein CheW
MAAQIVQTRDEVTEGSFVVFSLDDQRYALPLNRVQQAILAVAVTPLPEGPAIVLGIVDLGGLITPVINIRKRLNHPARDPRLSDHLIIADTGKRTVALLVDETRGVISVLPEKLALAEDILPGLALVAGAIKLEDGLILLHNLERLLSLEEDSAIECALRLKDEATL